MISGLSDLEIMRHQVGPHYSDELSYLKVLNSISDTSKHRGGLVPDLTHLLPRIRAAEQGSLEKFDSDSSTVRLTKPTPNLTPKLYDTLEAIAAAPGPTGL
jgi:hypothetical protein